MAARTAGVLLSKSIELSNEVYLAMQARGFRGDIPDSFRLSHEQVGLFRTCSLPLGREFCCVDGKVNRSMPALFELQDACFEYDGIPALRGLSLHIAQGERVVLLGANGSGKSTLLRIFDALHFASKGSVTFDGQRLAPEALPAR